MAEADGEEPGEACMSVAASIEAERELVEIGLDMGSAQAVIDAERPGLQVGEHPMDPGEHDMRDHGADDVWFVPDVLGAGIGGPAVGLGGGVLGEIVGEKAMQAGGGEVPDLGKSDASWPAVFDLDRASDQELASGAAAAATGDRIVA